ncbi:MAG: hypothetical protein NVSMB13_16100 [Mycobacteriales bacterium]
MELADGQLSTAERRCHAGREPGLPMRQLPDPASAPLPSARPRAYDAMVAAALDVRLDPATATFDDVLAAAVRAGRVDPAVGRQLRFWQRESIRGVRTHVGEVLPALLAALDAADRSAVAATADAERAWAATGRLGTADDGGDDLTIRRRHNVVAGLTGTR